MASNLGFVPFVLAASALLGSVPARAALPAPEAVPIRITPQERTLHRGDVLNVTVEVVNTSAVDLVRGGEGGGVLLGLVVPDGFRVDGGARVQAIGAREVAALVVPKGRLAVALGGVGEDGKPQALNLAHGQGLRFRYRLIAVSPAKVAREVVHRARLTAADDAPISSDAVVRLRVESEPELDTSVIFGSVYCDQNKSRTRDDGERGLGGVRFVADNGRTVDSDGSGAWHLREMAPGAHVVKLDVNTLGPGEAPTTSVRALVDLTPGTPARADFGVTCARGEAHPTEVTGPNAAPPASAVAPKARLSGLLSDLSITLDGERLAGRRVTLVLEGREPGKTTEVRAVNVPWRPGTLDTPIVFRTGVVGEPLPAAATTSWRLEVAAMNEAGGDDVVRVFSGRGTLPKALAWDGLDGDQVSAALKRGALHRARLFVSDGDGEMLTSAPALIGASFGGAGGELGRQQLRDGLFDKQEQPTAKLQAALRRLVAQLKKTPGARILVETHVDPGPVAEADLVKTRRQAFNVMDFAKNKLGLGSGQFLVVGVGSTRPMRPNIGPADRAFNRRVELVVLPPEVTASLVAPTLPVGVAQVSVQGLALAVDAKDPKLAFATETARDQVVAISLEAADGARRAIKRKVPSEPARKVDDASTGAPGETGGTDATGTKGTDPFARFGGDALNDALGPGAEAVPDGGPAGVRARTADELSIWLPAKGGLLGAPRVFVHGHTHPKNRLSIDDQAIHVGADGRFEAIVAVPSGKHNLAIVSRDPAGNVAKLAWPVEVKDVELFLLAMVDGVGGQIGARLAELPSYLATDNGSLFVAGRGALYAKARISGTFLKKDLFITAHADSAKKDAFEPFFEQVIDPGRDYVVYGDASQDVRDANARGPLYVLVEVDRSKLGWGSFHTDMEGIHLFHYDRTFDGAHGVADFEVAKGWRTKAQAFVTDANRKSVRRHDDLAATGGSLYYLSSRDIIEGSERVTLVVRELDTGIEIGRAHLARDRHYRIDYASGRVSMRGPIPSVVDALFQIEGYQPFAGRAILDGHPVAILIDYESRAVRSAGDLAFGVHATQEIAGWVEVGGGVIREGRPAGTGGSDEDHLAYSAHVKVKPSEHSTVFAEYVAARANDGVAQASTDGGLSYREVDRASPLTTDQGYGFSLGFDVDIGEIAQTKDVDLKVKAHWQLLQPGLHIAEFAAEEAAEKWGGNVIWKPTEDGRAEFRYDGGTVLIADAEYNTGYRAMRRHRLLGRYEHRIGAFDVFGEAGYGQHRDDLDGAVFTTGTVTAGARWRILKELVVMASQEALIGGDDKLLGPAATDRLSTNFGAELGLATDLALRLVETVRWNGDNATRFGLVSRDAKGGKTYIEERLQRGDSNGRLVHAMVVGTEAPLGPTDGSDGASDGRIYGEYRVDGGISGKANHAVVGLGRRLELVPGINLTLAYERSQALQPPAATTATGAVDGGSRDVVSGGLEVLALDDVKLGGLYEVRWDRDRIGEAAPEVFQAVARTTFDAKLATWVSLFGFIDYDVTQDLRSRQVLKEDLVATLGLAFRPLANSDFILAARWSRVLERATTRETTLFGEALTREERTLSDLVSLTGIIELPFRLQLTEKLVWRVGVGALDGASGSRDILLWITRLAFHVVPNVPFDIAAEFRMTASVFGSGTEQNGGLVEVAYTLFEHARLGLGWTMNGIAGELMPGEAANDIQNGFFVRLTGMY